ncbi:MAG: formylglycine-generating enzyme family protein [Polyangiaceae bacterium]
MVDVCNSDGGWGDPVNCDAAHPVCSDYACTSPPSCQASGPGLTDCGPTNESCCTSPEVPGGTYYRTYTNSGNGPASEWDPATVSGLRVDKYLVTVGRYKQFVSAWDGGAGWLPAAGSGKHAHLNGGLGIADAPNEDAGQVYEPGWMAADNDNVAPTDANLGACGTWSTWSASDNSNLPINCLNWYEAYAFCIWDGGFLPSEAELEYVAAGGSQQLQYPWGSTGPGTDNQYSIYGCYYPSGSPDASSSSCTGATYVAPVGTATKGIGLWGQFDLAGNMLEWSLDEWNASNVNPCVDCAYLSATYNIYRALRGACFASTVSSLAATFRGWDDPSTRISINGVRCARSP